MIIRPDVKIAASVMDALLCSSNGESHPVRATKFMGEKHVIRAVRRTYGGKVPSVARKPIEILLHIGRPNYAERQFIAMCKKVGEPFPISKIQLKYLSKKKVAA